MNYLVCIDDTDMPGTKGTGWLVQKMGEILSAKGLVECSPISRHQLFVHEDIPYTSHNSSMCFEMSLNKGTIDPVIDFMTGYLETHAARGSDPGLCVAGLGGELDRDRLIEFGKNAKQNVSSKEAAYTLARTVGIHLSEHGGTGDGVIGAVAGIGLRLSGNDGRYRGWYHLGQPGDIVRIDALCQYDFIDQLVTPSGIPLPKNTRVHIGSEKTKTVRMGSRQVVVAVKHENLDTGVAYRTITKQEAKQY